MKNTLAHLAGYLCVVLSDKSYDDPSMCHKYYPVFKMDRNEFELEYPEGTYSIYANHSGYAVKFDCGIRRTILLENGGKTLPLQVTKTPIPCPKVRRGTKVRYARGYWEKYLKTCGWTYA